MKIEFHFILKTEIEGKYLDIITIAPQSDSIGQLRLQNTASEWKAERGRWRFTLFLYIEQF